MLWLLSFPGLLFVLSLFFWGSPSVRTPEQILTIYSWLKRCAFCHLRLCVLGILTTTIISRDQTFQNCQNGGGEPRIYMAYILCPSSNARLDKHVMTFAFYMSLHCGLRSINIKHVICFADNLEVLLSCVRSATDG